MNAKRKQALGRRTTDKVLGAHAAMWRRMENEGKMQALGWRFWTTGSWLASVELETIEGE